MPNAYTAQQGLPQEMTYGQLRAHDAAAAREAVPMRVAQHRPISSGRGVSPDSGARGRGVTPEGRAIAR